MSPLVKLHESKSFVGPHARSRSLGGALACALLAAIAVGCNDGSSRSGPLRVVEARAVGAGTLPEAGLYVNGEIRVR